MSLPTPKQSGDQKYGENYHDQAAPVQVTPKGAQQRGDYYFPQHGPYNYYQAPQYGEYYYDPKNDQLSLDDSSHYSATTKMSSPVPPERVEHANNIQRLDRSLHRHLRRMSKIQHLLMHLCRR
ncbi:hypothetical protein KIN20_013033 [Parelaphostrongylus tenuis]|uniref:Uncharacterized protein n=1 Tax=Parelaphostrongylus tenuis TaxID=148309 RepID=A0AAD5MG11_PARTN|nr:hypothetical protein KIN20_013033 [Parelaphostrongylus tenuis]